MTERADYYMKRFLQEREKNEQLRGFLARAMKSNLQFEQLTADMAAEIKRLNEIVDKFSKPDPLKSETPGGSNVTSA